MKMIKNTIFSFAILVYPIALNASPLSNCATGDSLACYKIAKLSLEKYDNVKAAIFFEKSCEIGYAQACTELAGMYEYGIGVSSDKSKALALYNKACEAGDGKACDTLGGFYVDGAITIVVKDKQKAMKYYEKGCANSYASSCLNLGHATKEDYWYEKAKTYFANNCVEGDGEACYWLGSIYESGWGTEEDVLKAEEMFSKARSLGYSN